MLLSPRRVSFLQGVKLILKFLFVIYCGVIIPQIFPLTKAQRHAIIPNIPWLCQVVLTTWVIFAIRMCILMRNLGSPLMPDWLAGKISNTNITSTYIEATVDRCKIFAKLEIHSQSFVYL
jgi:hypothetical protein